MYYMKRGRSARDRTNWLGNLSVNCSHFETTQTEQASDGVSLNGTLACCIRNWTTIMSLFDRIDVLIISIFVLILFDHTKLVANSSTYRHTSCFTGLIVSQKLWLKQESSSRYFFTRLAARSKDSLDRSCLLARHHRFYRSICWRWIFLSDSIQ